MVLDMSDNGFLLMSTQHFEAGQTIDLHCELYPGKHLKCTLEVKHVGEAGVGTRIVEIDEEGRRLCQLYLQEHYSGRLEGMG